MIEAQKVILTARLRDLGVVRWDVARKVLDEIIEATLKPDPEALTVEDYKEVLEGHRKLVRELDVLLNGEAGAAKQASLIDVIAQIKKEQLGVFQYRVSLDPDSPGYARAWEPCSRRKAAQLAEHGGYEIQVYGVFCDFIDGKSVGKSYDNRS